MSPEMIGIFILIALVVGAAFYFTHNAKGEAQLAALEANVKAHASTIAADVKQHISQATSTPAAPAPAVVVVPPADQKPTDVAQ